MTSFAKLAIALLAMAAATASCIDIDEYDDSPEGNFDALWNILDQRYCFFEYKKQQYGLDWDEVYAKYRVRISSTMTSDQLFEVMADMLSELRDGHVNLSYAADYARYWSWQEDYPTNFSDTLLRAYLGTNYKIASGLQYRILDDNIGYVYYESFADGIGEGNMDEVMEHLMLCQGMILDIRSNGGGNLSNAEKLAARFTNEETLVGYMQHKTGPGHSDFSDMEEQRLTPSGNIRWQKNVVVLTNRSIYSAANEFVKYMKCLPGITVVGDSTGGGAGMPFNSSLPNGWYVRFSACPMYDRDGQATEFGIAPDYKVSLTTEDFLRGRDTMIEYARQLLSQ